MNVLSSIDAAFAFYFKVLFELLIETRNFPITILKEHRTRQVY